MESIHELKGKLKMGISNYRLVRTVNSDGSISFGIYIAKYSPSHKVSLKSKDPLLSAQVKTTESLAIAALRQELRDLTDALIRPILEESNFELTER